jgi:amino acid transporter
MPTESSVRTHSAELKQELGLFDLVFSQILFIMGMTWVGAAAKLGPSHVTFWMFAVVLFYIPSAIVVIHLSRKMPLEGGLYQWAKIGFDERIGFLVAWNLWIYSMILNSEIGLIASTNIAYALGPSAHWIVESKWFIGGASAVIVAALCWLSVIGLGAGKWLHLAGGIMMVAVLVSIIILPVIDWFHGGHPHTQPFSLALPAFTLLNLNILGKIGFGALGGFEFIAIFAGETRNASKQIARSVMIAAPVIATLFILGTGSVLWIVGDQNIDLISPISQVLAIGTKPLGIGASVASIVILTVLGMRVAQVSVNFAGTARLPMVAGWDDLLPAWFTRLHPKHRTPMQSIMFVGAMTFAFSIGGMLGVGSQEAMQLLNNASGIYYALTYLVMFAVPIASPGAPRLVKAAATSGFCMTLLYVALSIFPIIEVENRFWFTAKISSVVIGGNVVGVAILWLAELRKRRHAG